MDLDRMKMFAAYENAAMRSNLRGQNVAPYLPGQEYASDWNAHRQTSGGRKPSYDQEQIKSLIRQGYSTRDISEMVGCVRSNVSRIRGEME